MKTVKIGKVLNFCHFRGHFGSLWGHFRHSQKSPKIFTNTYRMELNLCQLNSVNAKNPFDLNIFLSHMKYGRKIITIWSFSETIVGIDVRL